MDEARHALARRECRHAPGGSRARASRRLRHRLLRRRIHDETPRVRSYALGLPSWTPHRPGQHYDLRLTAADGYSVQRSYSIASGPEKEGEIEVTVERVVDGEVSPFLHDVAVVGDRIEV